MVRDGSKTAWLGSGDGENFIVGCPSGSFIEVRVRVHAERRPNQILSLIQRFSTLVTIWARFFLGKISDSTSAWG
jgi:hypothetical protein